jgi:hypothetical protein
MTALLLLSLSANAEVIAEAINNGGGTIALTNVPCKSIANTSIAYSYIKNGQSLLGCWTLEGDRVFIQWNDGDLRSYNAGTFVVKKAKQYL